MRQKMNEWKQVLNNAGGADNGKGGESNTLLSFIWVTWIQVAQGSNRYPMRCPLPILSGLYRCLLLRLPNWLRADRYDIPNLPQHLQRHHPACTNIVRPMPASSTEWWIPKVNNIIVLHASLPSNLKRSIVTQPVILLLPPMRISTNSLDDFSTPQHHSAAPICRLLRPCVS